MGFAALDDGFFANPKILAAGYDAAGVYCMGLSYCAKYLTDGYVPILWTKAHPRKLVSKLEETGLWEVCDGGHRIPDYLQYNPSRAQVEERRNQAKEAADSRWKGGAGSNAKRNADRKAKRTPTSNALPSPSSTSESNDSDAVRPRDRVWDKMTELFGPVAPKTNAHSRRNKAVADLKRLQANPESIHSAFRRWDKKFSGATVTDIALATHYPQLVNGTIHSPKPETDKGKVSKDVPDVLGGF